MKTLLTSLAICTVLSAPAAQEASDSSQLPVLEMSTLKLVHYSPSHVPSPILGKFLRDSAGRQIYIAERGGLRSAPIYNVSVLGSSLVLYDTVEQVNRILDTLKEIDVDGSNPSLKESVVTRRFVLRHLAATAAERALQTFDNGTRNVITVEDRRVIVLRDTPARVEEMEALLRDLDIPEDQFQVHVRLIRGIPGAGEASGIPAELTRELAQLLPAFQFESIGFALLQSSANPRRPVQLGIECEGARYDLMFSPVAYDPFRGDLTVQDCVLHKTSTDDGEIGFMEIQQVFSTDTVFRGGEYTVLGAAGAEPVFVVVRVQARE